MADDSLYDRRTLEEAAEGFRAFSRRFEELAGGNPDPVGNMIRFLRTLPADDFGKKTGLARFFQSPEGQQYSSEERRKAYDELLGRDRNRRTYG